MDPNLTHVQQQYLSEALVSFLEKGHRLIEALLIAFVVHMENVTKRNFIYPIQLVCMVGKFMEPGDLHHNQALAQLMLIQIHFHILMQIVVKLVITLADQNILVQQNIHLILLPLNLEDIP